MKAVSGLTEDAAAMRPVPERWSIVECVEHLAVVEEYLFSQVLAARLADTPMVNQKREERIMARGSDRTRPIAAPEVARPTSRFSTLAEALAAFMAARDRTIEFVRNCQDDTRSMITSHPIMGTVNVYETLLTIVVHPHRHARQIEENRAALE